MRKKIFQYVCKYMAIVLAVSMAAIIFTLHNHFISLEQDRLRSEAQIALAGLETDSKNFLQNIHKDSQFRFTWINTDGTVLYDSEADASKMENHLDREEVQQALADGEGTSIRLSDTIAQKTIYYAVKANDGTVLRLSRNYDTIGILTLRMMSPILIILIGSFILSSLLANKLSRDIASPINQLDLDHPLDAKTYEEITPLLIRIDTQNSQIEEQLNQLHQKKKEFQTVIGNISEGLILINPKGEILSINEAALNLFHTSSVSSIYDITKDDKFTNTIASVLHGNVSDCVLHLLDRTLHISCHPVTSHKVQTGASILVYDITEEYEAEQTRREFTANVSHELKTPLQSIMGSAELLENHLVKKEDEPKFLQKIHSESSRMLTLIDDIIRLSELDEGNVADEQTTIQIKDLAREAYEAVHTAANKKQITINIDLQDSPVRCNSRLLYEIAYNLLDNAIKYTNENETVQMKTYCDQQNAYLLVEDNGIGIPHESLNRIFERFYRVDKSHSRETGGTGLGLSIVKHAVNLCHGKISVTSEVNKGSTFKVVFPKS